jgi:hypothetical protein
LCEFFILGTENVSGCHLLDKLPYVGVEINEAALERTKISIYLGRYVLLSDC